MQRDNEVAAIELDHVPALQITQFTVDDAPNADDHVPALQLIQRTFGRDVAPFTLDHNPALHRRHAADDVLPRVLE